MAGNIEYGTCDVCKKDAPLQRKYYHYNIKCECHAPNHFELVKHCADCTPVEPKETKITLKTSNLIKGE